MSFLFVDRILALDPGRYVSGIKHITLSDAYLYRGRTGKPALLPSIIGEALGQLGAWNAMQSCGFTRRPVAGVANQINIYDDAYVGQSLFLETFIDACDEQAVEYHSIARIGDRVIFTIEHALGPMLPMQDFIDPVVVKSQFQMINRPGPVPTTSNDINSISNSHDVCSISEKSMAKRISNYVGFDHILSWQKATRVVAEKKISLAAPYFADHFPRKPVLPLTVLMSAKLEVACQFIADIVGEENKNLFFPTQLRKIKMNEFVLPGSVVTTELQLREMNSEQIIIGFRSEVEGKRVCVAEAEFRACSKADEVREV